MVYHTGPENKIMSKNKAISIPNKDCFSRMNFLYQASLLMAGKNNTLSAFYGQLCRTIGKKGVIRLEPELKRNLCTRCSLPMQPSITANIEIQQRPVGRKRKRRYKTGQDETTIDENTELHVICLQCKFRRNYKIGKQELWLEQPDCVVEKITMEK